MRLLIILHLCLVCTLICWFLGRPFTLHHLDGKVDQLLVEQVGDEGLPSRIEPSFGHFFREGITSLLRPPISLWLLLSLLLCIPLLLGVVGIASAAWLLPLLIALYPLYAPPQSNDFFPTEAAIFDLLGEAPASRWSEQRVQLERGWALYLESRGEVAILREQLVRLRNRELPPARISAPIWILILIWNLLFAVTQVAKEWESGWFRSAKRPQ